MENNLKDQYYKNMSIMPEMETLTFEAESILFVFRLVPIHNNCR